MVVDIVAINNRIVCKGLNYINMLKGNLNIIYLSIVVIGRVLYLFGHLVMV